MIQCAVFRPGSFPIRTGGLSRRGPVGSELLSHRAGHAKLLRRRLQSQAGLSLCTAAPKLEFSSDDDVATELVL
jgi:hypothetical protein